MPRTAESLGRLIGLGLIHLSIRYRSGQGGVRVSSKPLERGLADEVKLYHHTNADTGLGILRHGFAPSAEALKGVVLSATPDADTAMLGGCLIVLTMPRDMVDAFPLRDANGRQRDDWFCVPYQIVNAYQDTFEFEFDFDLI
jgi:hypothetical protein